MTEVELRAMALVLAAEWIRSNLAVGCVSCLDELTEGDQVKLGEVLFQLSGELDELATKGVRRRRQAGPKVEPPFHLMVTRVDGPDDKERRYKTSSGAMTAAVNLMNSDNMDPYQTNPVQKVWVFEGDKVRICYTVNGQGRAVIDRDAHRNIGVEAPTE